MHCTAWRNNGYCQCIQQSFSSCQKKLSEYTKEVILAWTVQKNITLGRNTTKLSISRNPAPNRWRRWLSQGTCRTAKNSSFLYGSASPWTEGAVAWNLREEASWWTGTQHSLNGNCKQRSSIRSGMRSQIFSRLNTSGEITVTIMNMKNLFLIT